MRFSDFPYLVSTATFKGRPEASHSPKFAYLKILPFILLFPLFTGCSALVISAAGAGAGAGIPYILSNSADRTLNFPFDQVSRATLKVLKKMDFSVTDNSETENGKRIKAAANDLNITIDVEQVTVKATRITIDAQKGLFLKDKATAEEIINQLDRMLAKK